MSKVHLLNTSFMPQPGHYTLEEIDKTTFASEVQKAHTEGILDHYIYYSETLMVVQQLTGIEFSETNMNETRYQDGDRFLVIRLAERAHQKIAKKMRAQEKHADFSISDFLFYRGTYTATQKE